MTYSLWSPAICPTLEVEKPNRATISTNAWEGIVTWRYAAKEVVNDDVVFVRAEALANSRDVHLLEMARPQNLRGGRLATTFDHGALGIASALPC